MDLDGRKIRVLSIIVNLSRVSLAFDKRMSCCGSDVVQTLERLATVYGLPERIRLDDETEFISKISTCKSGRMVPLDFSRHGKPTYTAFWFLNLDDARVKCVAWRFDYNEVRPHSFLGNPRR